ncbi:MAG: hypothetical protein ACLPHI_21995 [Terriglobales bacterium]
MKRFMAVVLSMALVGSVIAAQAQQDTSTTTAKTTHKKPAPKSTVSEQLEQLKQAIDAQQMQIKQLSDQVQSRDQRIQQLEQRLDQSQAVATQAQTAAADAANKAAAVETQTSQQQQAVVALKSDVTDLKTSATNAAMSLQEAEKNFSAFESPTTLHLKGVNITPGGFAAAEFVRRSRELGADLPTPFNSLTMPGASQSQLPEFFGSARQSRPTVYIMGHMKNVELSSYISADFLSAGITSNNNQTDSYTLRLRQAWAQAKFDNGWKFLGGQMWSLVTENRVGIGPSDDTGRVNDARPLTIDPSYNVGFTFARQYGLRVTKDFSDKLSVAFAIENAQGTVTTHNNADNYLLGEEGASNSFNTTANYTANPAPDLIAKIAFDPGVGHYEIFGLADRFSDRVFPCVEYAAGSPQCTATGATSATGAYNSSKEGGGFGANARWTLADKHVVFGLHGFGGSGIGRYGASGLSDLSINANGTVHLIKGLQGLATLEWHGKKLDVYAYTGAEYAARTYDYDPLGNSGKGQFVGYGAPTFLNYGCYSETAPSGTPAGFNPGALAHCTADTRAVIEGTAGFWYRFYNGPKGRFQFGSQYSYVSRQTWTGANSALTPGALGPQGLDGMVFTSFRYYLP